MGRLPTRISKDRRRLFWDQLHQRALQQGGPLIDGWHVNREHALDVFLRSAVLYVHYHYKFLDGRYPAVNLSIYDAGDLARNQRFYDALHAYKAEIDAQFGDRLEWRREPGKNLGASIDHPIALPPADEERWPELQDTMISQMKRLRGTIDPYINAIAEHRSLADVATASRARRLAETADRQVKFVRRTIRDSEAGRLVKALYGCACQICGRRLKTPTGLYAEAAHIKPVEHKGPDIAENLLCLCPNCHVLFDYGAIILSPALELHDMTGAYLGTLKLHRSHTINSDYIADRYSSGGSL